MNTDGVDVRRGRLMNRNDGRGKGFKLVVVLGDAPRSPGKVRVCVWSANSASWSNPQTVSPHGLGAIYYSGLSSRHRAVVDKAMQHIRQRQNTVLYGRGAYQVGDPWCADRRVKPKTVEGITKLAPAVAHVEVAEISGTIKGTVVQGRMVAGEISMSAASKEQLQKLNAALSDVFLGRRKS